MSVFVGIDPGLDGAIVLLHSRFERLATSAGLSAVTAAVGQEIEAHAMPTLQMRKDSGRRDYDIGSLRRLFETVARYPDVMVLLEKQQAMPAAVQGRRQGGASTFSTGYGFGLLVGLLSGLQIPYTIIHPRSWQAELFHGLPKGNTKATALVVAQRLFPATDLRISDRARKPHGGKVDALLLAEYGRRMYRRGEACAYRGAKAEASLD